MRVSRSLQILSYLFVVSICFSQAHAEDERSCREATEDWNSYLDETESFADAAYIDESSSKDVCEVSENKIVDQAGKDSEEISGDQEYFIAAAVEPECTGKKVDDNDVHCGWLSCTCWAKCGGSRYWYATSGLHIFTGFPYEHCSKNCSDGITAYINQDLGITNAWQKCVSVSFGSCPTDGKPLS